MRRMSVDGYLGGAKAMQDWSGSAERLHEIAVPTLVLVGDQDQLLAASRVIHARITNSRFVLLRGSGHSSTMWRPAAVLEATLTFVSDVEAGRPVAGEVVVA
jgi:pimeloyl-ACP methyl ester carboxylesterase